MGFKFDKIWDNRIEPKKSFLHIIMHRSIWTNAIVAKIGMGNECYPRCKSTEETIINLFIECPFNKPVLQFIQAYIATIFEGTLSCKLLFLRERIRCSS